MLLCVGHGGGAAAPERVVLETRKGGNFELLFLADIHELHRVVILHIPGVQCSSVQERECRCSADELNGGDVRPQRQTSGQQAPGR